MRSGRHGYATASWRACALGLLLLAPGCASDPAAPTAPAGPDPQIAAFSVYGRHSAVRGKVDLRLANRGPDVVEVERFQVRSPLFATVAPYDRPSELVADGQESIVPVPFGEPLCDVQDGSGAVVVLTVRTGDRLHDVAVPLVDREPGLVRAHRLDCERAAVTDTAAVELAGSWERDADGRRLHGRLHLTRLAPGRLAVSDVVDSILFSVDAPPHRPLLVLDEGAPEASVDLVFRATRCDQHALIESKTSFTFPVSAVLGDGQAVVVPVTFDDQGRAALQSLLDDTCGARPTS